MKTFANHLQPKQLLPLCRLRESSSRSFQSKSSFRPQNNEWMRDAAWLSPSLGGGGLSPPWKTHWTGSIHQILSIIHSFNLITAAAQPSRRTTPHHTPPRRTRKPKQKQQKTTPCFPSSSRWISLRHNVWKYRHSRGKLKEMKQLKKKNKQLAASITAQHAASLSA